VQKKIGVIGLGYVGIPLALRISEKKIPCIGFDIDTQRVDQLNGGKSPLSHIPDSSIAKILSAGFEVTRDYSRVSECNAILVCVPTPLTANREPDMSYIEGTIRSILPYLRDGQILVLESTTWPGTTQELISPMVETVGLVPGKTIHLVYSPEREDPGNSSFQTHQIPKIVGADFSESLTQALELYQSFIDVVVPMNSTKAAEMVKLYENIYRAVNIGLINEMKVISKKMEVNIFDIIDAAGTKPFGFTKYFPGPGVGGHCIPLDPFYLTWKVREFGLHTRFIELAGELNASMPKFVIDQLIKALNDRSKSLRGAKILCIGLAYKANVNDARESPSVHILELLRSWGADYRYHDPFIPEFPRMREHSFNLASVSLSQELIAEMDAVLILTPHDEIDYSMIYQSAKLIIDSRGIYRSDPNNKVVLA